MKSFEKRGQQLEMGLVSQAAPKHELSREFYTKARDGKHREYVYNFAKARACTHPTMKAMSIGGSAYRCEECNYSFDIVTANMQPLHNRVIGDMMNMLHFTKEFGVRAFEEVLRTPIGQYDGTPHKPVLPEGIAIAQALMMMDSVNVMVPDGGKAELTALLDDVWVSPDERDRKQKQLAGKGVPNAGDQLAQRGLNAGSPEERPKLTGGGKGKRKKPEVRSLSK